MKSHPSKKALPISLILVLPLLKTIFELGGIFFLLAMYCLFIAVFGDVHTTIEKVMLVIFLLTTLFIFVIVK